MNTIEVKTSELLGPFLDWAVAKCEGRIIGFNLGGGLEVRGRTESGAELPEYWDLWTQWNPSTDWAQGGPIIEEEEIGIKRNAPCFAGREWEASPSITAKGAGGKFGYGPTPLIAAMRCRVASELGDTVQIPKELMP